MVNETPKEAALRLFDWAIKDGYQFVSGQPYKDTQGNTIYWRPRLEHADGRKIIRPMRLHGHGYELKEPKFPGRRKPLYALDWLASRTDAEVWIVEGEKKADALNALGLVATTSGGASSAKDADFEILRGRRCCIWADKDDPGKAYAGEVAKILIGLDCAVTLIDIDRLGLGPTGDVVDWLRAHPEANGTAIEALTRLTPSPQDVAAAAGPPARPAPASVELLCGADIEPEAIKWLWHEWIAAGKLHILAGAPGTGKTTIALALAATLSIGGRWPDGTRAPIGNVLMWSSEDAPADVLVPRIHACGGNLSRVHFVGDSFDEEGRRPFDPATDMRALEVAAEKIGGVQLLIIDPIVSAVAGDSHKSTETRRALQPIVDLAAKLGCAVLGISHFSKGTSGREPLERVTGSLAFGALARVVLAAAKMPDDAEGNGGRLLARAKSNIGPDSGGFHYDLKQVELDRYPGVYASQLLWGHAIEGSARELLAQAEAQEPENGSELGDAAEWLQTLLREEGGQLDRRDVMRAAKAIGHAERTVHRARQKIDVAVTQTGFGKDKRSLWKLPENPNRANPAKELNREMHGTNGTHGAIEPNYEDL